MAKALPCPESTLGTPLPHQSSSSTREEEGRWVLMEDRQRQSAAFETVAKEMLRYLENSEEYKKWVSRNCKNNWRYLHKYVLRCSKWLSRRGIKGIKRFLKSFVKKKKSFVLPAGQGGTRSGKAWWSWKESVRTQVRKYKCWAKDKKYSKMRLKASSECKAEQLKIAGPNH